MDEIVKSLSLVILLWLSRGTAVEIETPEVTTESLDYGTYVSTERTTESPNNNGMAIGEIPQVITTENVLVIEQNKEVEDVEEETPAVLVTFPENHKNFTPGPYIEQDIQPYYQLSDYQQQYKNYYEQKAQFNGKPTKLESSSTTHYYPPQIATTYFDVEEETKKAEESRLTRKPFPYSFEVASQAPQNWLKNTVSGQIEVHENPLADDNPYKHTITGHIEVHAGGNQESGNLYDAKLPNNGYLYQEQPVPLLHQITPIPLVQQVTPIPLVQQITQYPPHATPIPYYIVPHKSTIDKRPAGKGHHHHFYHDIGSGFNVGTPWKKILQVLTALVPLSLFLATLTPSIITVNTTTPVINTRQRSVDLESLKFKEEDVMRLLKEYGVDSLHEAQCEDRVICELARLGNNSSANSIEKGFWFLANETPWHVAEKVGMNDLFKAIKTGNCDIYKCEAKTKSGVKTTITKKIIKKRRISPKKL